MSIRTVAATAGAACLALAATAWAVQPGTWTHQSEADFTDAEKKQTVVTSLGEVQLARDTEERAALTDGGTIVYDMARLGDGRTLLAVGPDGQLAALEDGEARTLAGYDGGQVFALAPAKQKDAVWVAVSGAESKIELRSGEELKADRTIPLPEARYVWDVIPAGGALYVATGTEGRVLRIGLEADEPKPETILETKQDNILCLDMDPDGRIYAGTDGEGLVYRLTPKENGEGFTPFVMYDADEPEIGDLIVTDDGTVFAGTADADQARPGRLEEAATEQTGRPEEPKQEGGQQKEPDVPNVPPKPEPKAKDAAKKPSPQKGAKQDAKGGSSSGGRETGPNEPATPDAEGGAAGQAEKTGSSKEAQRPTAEQYDKLRAEVKNRLTQAKESGALRMQRGAEEGPDEQVTDRLRSKARRGGSGASASGEGNAIYRINAEGFVREVFRESVMILRLMRTEDGSLLAATGNQGQLYHIDPDAEEVAILADLEALQVPAMLAGADGDVLLGTANPARILRLSDGHADEGALTSDALDASQISLWGTLRLTAKAPDGTGIAVQTRSGNVSDPEAGAWSDWSEPQAVELNNGRSAYLPVGSPNARFLQYRLRLRSDGEATPAVTALSLKYLMPNLPPQIQSVTTEYENGGSNDKTPEAQQKLTIEWKASDANDDTLRYRVEARPYGDESPYVPIARDLKKDKHEWDTRTMPDGRYVLRVTATDETDNVPAQAMTNSRRSNPVLIDNTPPRVEELTVEPAGDGDGDVRVGAELADATSPIADIRYAVDSQSDWQMALPRDMIFDSTTESLAVTIEGLEPGRHAVSLRVTDALGNSRYVSRTVDIEP